MFRIVVGKTAVKIAYVLVLVYDQEIVLIVLKYPRHYNYTEIFVIESICDPQIVHDYSVITYANYYWQLYF